MFGMGFFEILIILIVAIIFLGPDKLPQAIVDIARFFKTIKKISQDAKETFDKEINLQHLKQEVIDYKTHFTNEIDEITKDIQPKAITSDISNDIKTMFDEYKNLPNEINKNPSNKSLPQDSKKQDKPYSPIESSPKITQVALPKKSKTPTSTKTPKTPKTKTTKKSPKTAIKE